MQVRHFAIELLTVSLLALGLARVDAKSIPKEFTQCNENDPNLNDCMKGAVQSAIIAMKNGLPEYQLFPIDPLAVTQLSIEQGKNRPISVKIDLSNAQLTGLSSAKVNGVTADIKNRQFTIQAACDELHLDGDYEMDGKFLLLPLRGKGKTQMALTGFEADVSFKADGVKNANGDLYWDVKSVNLKVTKVKKFQVHFDNLFNGDKVLGESTNKALNDNWEGFWAEIGPAMEEAFGEVFRSIGNVLMSKIEEKNIFSH